MPALPKCSLSSCDLHAGALFVCACALVAPKSRAHTHTHPAMVFEFECAFFVCALAYAMHQRTSALVCVHASRIFNADGQGWCSALVLILSNIYRDFCCFGQTERVRIGKGFKRKTNTVCMCALRGVVCRKGFSYFMRSHVRAHLHTDVRTFERTRLVQLYRKRCTAVDGVALCDDG